MSAGDLATARSFFIAPGTAEEQLTAALASDAHAVIADFEDMVAPPDKARARSVAQNLFTSSSGPLKLVRINAPGTEGHEADLATLATLAVDAIVVPKGTPELIGRLGSDGPPVLALIETGQGVRLAYETAALPQVVGLVIAPGDLSKDLKMQLRSDGQSLLYTRTKLVVDSAAAGARAPIDVPSSNEGKDLESDVEYARSLGLWGKLCLKPGQATVINAVYGSQPAALAH